MSHSAPQSVVSVRCSVSQLGWSRLVGRYLSSFIFLYFRLYFPFLSFIFGFIIFLYFLLYYFPLFSPRRYFPSFYPSRVPLLFHSFIVLHFPIHAFTPSFISYLLSFRPSVWLSRSPFLLSHFFPFSFFLFLFLSSFLLVLTRVGFLWEGSVVLFFFFLEEEEEGGRGRGGIIILYSGCLLFLPLPSAPPLSSSSPFVDLFLMCVYLCFFFHI